MNKTININLASTFFHIDEDAYDLLGQYLNRLKAAFKNTVGKEEILDDIEARIAELFQEYKKHTEYVINKNDVNKMIETLGQPEDFVLEEEPQESGPRETIGKKLFRDPDDQYIGGVASGMGHYFSLDSVWMRLIWLLLAFLSGGTFVFIYILLWVLIPKAVTTADKLKMKGEPVNIANIERKIKEGFDNVSEKIKNVDYDEAKSSLKKKSKNFFSFLEDLLVLLLKSVSKIIGVVLILVATLTLIGLSISFISFAFIGVINWPLPLFDGLFEFSDYPLWIPLSLLFFSISIPFVFVFILGVKLIAPSSNPFGLIGRFVLLGVWLISIILLGVFSINEVRAHSVLAHHKLATPITLKKQDTLKIGLKKENSQKNEQQFLGSNFKFYYDNLGEKWLYGDDIIVNIKASTDTITSLEIKKFANGSDFVPAKNSAKAIVYEWEASDDLIKIANYWETPIENKFHSQKVELTFWIAEGQKIQISKRLSSLLDRHIDNDQDFSRRKLPNNTWIMGKNELKCLDCEIVF